MSADRMAFTAQLSAWISYIKSCYDALPELVEQYLRMPPSLLCFHRGGGDALLKPSFAPPMDAPHEFLFKLILIGDSGAGKTSLMRRYTDDIFAPDSASTIGVDFKIKTVRIGTRVVKLQIWDTAGQERFRAIVAHYYRGANGILLVFDLTNPDSFTHVGDWLDELARRGVPSDTQLRILGNKLDDTAGRAVSTEAVHAFLQARGISLGQYCEVSAQDGSNVEKAFTELAETLVKAGKSAPTASKIAFKMDDQPKRAGCC